MATNLDDPELMQSIDFVDERERQLFATAQLGYQVRAFLVGPAGRYLHGRAKQELEDVKNELVEIGTPPWWSRGQRRRWNRLQARAHWARSFMTWCADALTEGVAAEDQLEAEYD